METAVGKDISHCVYKWYVVLYNDYTAHVKAKNHIFQLHDKTNKQNTLLHVLGFQYSCAIY